MGDPITLHVLTAKLLCINNKVALLKRPIFLHCLGEDRRVGGDGWRRLAGRDAAVPRVKRDIVWGCADAPRRATPRRCNCCTLHPRTPRGCATAAPWGRIPARDAAPLRAARRIAAHRMRRTSRSTAALPPLSTALPPGCTGSTRTAAGLPGELNEA